MTNILHKYSDQIEIISDAVKISPKNYRNPKTDWTKDWRVYFSVNINGKQFQKKFLTYYLYGVRVNLNKASSHADKIKRAEKLQQAIIHKLKYNPLLIVLILHGKEGAALKYPELFKVVDKNTVTAVHAFEEVYKVIDGSNLSKSRKDQLRQFKNRFLKYIGEETDVADITKKKCVKYLDTYRSKSNKTFNNEKEYLSTYLKKFVSYDYVEQNFVKDIDNEKVKPNKNKPFDLKDLPTVWELLSEHPVLEFYCMHVYYGLLRLVEINRLKCKDINLDSDYLDIDSRKSERYRKVFDERLKQKYKELDLSEGEKYIFCKKRLIGDWHNDDNGRRTYYSKWFKKVVKDKMGLGKEYGINSLRHNAHYSFYMNVRKKLESEGSSNAHIEACEKIMIYAGKKTVAQVETYLREVDFKLNFDYAQYID